MMFAFTEPADGGHLVRRQERHWCTSCAGPEDRLQPADELEAALRRPGWAQLGLTLDATGPETAP